jgi:hypothetical protein
MITPSSTQNPKVCRINRKEMAVPARGTGFQHISHWELLCVRYKDKHVNVGFEVFTA